MILEWSGWKCQGYYIHVLDINDFNTLKYLVIFLHVCKYWSTKSLEMTNYTNNENYKYRNVFFVRILFIQIPAVNISRSTAWCRMAFEAVDTLDARVVRPI